MTSMTLVALDRPGLAPLPISARLKSQLVYFASPVGGPGVPDLKEGEYFFAADEAARYRDEGVIYLVSPLDTANKTEIELSEEQETFLQWLLDHGVQHVRVRD